MMWLAGAVGLAALIRHLSRRAAPAASQPQQLPMDEDPADELRRRLADQRVDGETSEEPASEDAPVDLEERRARVHARAQEAIDAMHEGEADEAGDPDDGAVA